MSAPRTAPSCFLSDAAAGGRFCGLVFALTAKITPKSSCLCPICLFDRQKMTENLLFNYINDHLKNRLKEEIKWSVNMNESKQKKQ